MLTQEDARIFLQKYETQLENFQTYQQNKIFTRTGHAIVPNILAALTAISLNKPFTPINASGSSISPDINLSADNPGEAIRTLLANENFKGMLDHYLNHDNPKQRLDPGLYKSLIEFQENVLTKFPLTEQKKQEPLSQPQAQIILYRTDKQELAVKFPDKETANIFMDKLRTPNNFPDTDQFNKGKPCFNRYPNNPTTIYFPGRTAGKGEFTCDFPSERVRRNFCELVLKNPGYNPDTDSKFIGTGPEYKTPIIINKNTVYFEDKVFFQKGKNVSVSMSDDLKPTPSSRMKI